MSTFSYEDVVPLTLNETQPQLCQILYTDEYKKTMGTLLALLQQEEYSERALALTEEGINLLASHYTIWNYRYQILMHMQKDLFEELDWCESIALENEKNYQIWNYRQLVIEKILQGDSSGRFNPHREYPIVNAMLEADIKNHHVWSYRKWLVERFELYDDEKEVDFINKCIQADLRNNSAWSHRFFTKFSRDGTAPQTVEAEMQYAKQQIETAPQNPSSWNYLKGIYAKFHRDLCDLEEFCASFVNMKEIGAGDESQESTTKSSYAMELLAKIYVQKHHPAKAAALFDLLIAKYDPIRANYWTYEKARIEAV